MSEHTSLEAGKLYILNWDLRLTGTHEGQPAYSTVPKGTCVIPVLDRDGNEAILVSGVVVRLTWRNSSLFDRVACDEPLNT